MPHYIMMISWRRMTSGITLPRTWVKNNLKPGDKYIYMTDNGDETLTLMTERKWYEKVVSKAGDVKDIRARKTNKG
jgi:hydrogenase maturation factor